VGCGIAGSLRARGVHAVAFAIALVVTALAQNITPAFQIGMVVVVLLTPVAFVHAQSVPGSIDAFVRVCACNAGWLATVSIATCFLGSLSMAAVPAAAAVGAGVYAARSDRRLATWLGRVRAGQLPDWSLVPVPMPVPAAQAAVPRLLLEPLFPRSTTVEGLCFRAPSTDYRTAVSPNLALVALTSKDSQWWAAFVRGATKGVLCGLLAAVYAVVILLFAVAIALRSVEGHRP
jgi:hypothetical protein